MSLSVNNTGYSNSQAQSTATSLSSTQHTATTEPNTYDSEQIVDPITGKTLTFRNNIKISAEAMARLKENAANAPRPNLSELELSALKDEILKNRNLILQSNTSTSPNLGIQLSTDNISTNEKALENWSNHLKEDSGITKEAFVGLVHQALSKPSSVTLWSYATDSIEITLKSAKLEELKNRYVNSDYHQDADRDIQNFVQYQSDALSNLEKNILQDEYQRSVDAGDTDKASATFQELQKNAEGTSATQLQRQQIFALTTSTDVPAWFGSFHNYIDSSDFDRYTKSEYNSIVSQFYSHWASFQHALK